MPSSSSLFYLPSLFLDCLSDWTGVSEPVISRILVYYLFATVAHYSWSVFTARPREKKTKQELSYDAEVIDTSTITAAKRARRSSTLKMPPSFSNKDDASILEYLQTGQVSLYSLETFLNDFERAVKIRRLWIGKLFKDKLKTLIGDKIKTTALDTDDLPYKNYDYSQIYGKCCESVIGFVPIPVGIAGPIKIDHQVYYVPMATTEGCLIASTSRGCKALMLSQGVTTEVYGDAMTRAPVLELPTAVRAVELKRWIESPSSWSKLKEAFESTSRFAKLVQIKAQICGKLAFVRFSARTGDAMGMNMVSKGVENTLKMLRNHFPDVEVISLSGNVCTDKKPSAVNWIEGRGKSVVAEATIPGEVLRKVLKTTSKDLVRLNTTKNLVGSAMAGSLGGFNAHAANIVTAVFAATGQDIAQNVESSSCLTLMECTNNDQDLYISCTMPSIEVGTIGGGTELLAQATNLHLLGVNGPNTNNPGENAERLARIVCATVLAGELSLCAALTGNLLDPIILINGRLVGDLVKSHMRLNRKQN